MKIIIAGAGKLGTKVAEALEVGDYSVTIIDKDAETVHRIAAQMDVMTVNANAKQISILEEIGIENYDYLLASTDDDEKNIFIAAAAKKLGCKKVIARVRDPEHLNQMEFIKEAMSIDFIINPDLSITMEIYKYLVEKYTLSNGIFSTGRVSLVEFSATRMKSLIGHTMFDMPSLLPDMLVVGISRNGKVIIPHGPTEIQGDDILYVVGKKAKISELNSKVHEKGKYHKLQRVMILGGGKTGLFLAEKLSDFGTAVKIIEIDKLRCQYLASHLNNVMVLHGDATDVDLLEQENWMDMDAIVAVTGYDEENLLLALMAKQHSIEDVIAKISRESYAPLVESMGIDMALNPVEISASHILRFIRGGRRVLSSQLIQGQAELMEILAVNSMTLVNKPLKDLKLPDGMIIAAIHKGKEVIIPNGNTIILENDRVVVLCLLSDLQELEKRLKTGGESFFSSKI